MIDSPPKTLIYTAKRRKQESPKFEYTPEGLSRISVLIEATLDHRDWSVRKLAKEAKNIVASTIIRYINAETSPPDEKIKAIAPFIYKAVRFIGNDSVEIDPTQTYQKWEELASIGTDNCNVPIDKPTMKFSEMVRLAMQANNISQEHLELEAQKMIDAQATFMSLERLREIQLGLGEIPMESERRVFYVIIDPKRRVYTDNQWLGQKPAIKELRDNGNHVNR